MLVLVVLAGVCVLAVFMFALIAAAHQKREQEQEEIFRKLAKLRREEARIIGAMMARAQERKEESGAGPAVHS